MRETSAQLAAVSVVVPCYRCGHTIERALRSIAEQSLLPAEVLVVEDGSGDDTLSLVRGLAEKYSEGWIRVIALEKNQGAATARNAGWDEARYPFVAFLDSDDAWHTRKIEIQYTFMSVHSDVAICGHRHYTTNDDGADVEGDANSGGNVTVLSRVAMLLSNRFITPSVMVRRDLQLRFEEGRRHMEDHLLWMQAVCAGNRVVRLEAPLARIFKAPYGSRGLSGELWAMELGSLKNYWSLRRDHCIGWAGMLVLMGYSLLKYCRRVVIVAMRKSWGIVQNFR